MGPRGRRDIFASDPVYFTEKPRAEVGDSSDYKNPGNVDWGGCNRHPRSGNEAGRECHLLAFSQHDFVGMKAPSTIPRTNDVTAPTAQWITGSQTTYDPLGRVTGLTDVAGHTSTTTYTPAATAAPGNGPLTSKATAGTAVGLIDSTKSSAVPLPKRSQFGANSCDSARQRTANFFGTHEFARHCLFMAARRTLIGRS